MKVPKKIQELIDAGALFYINHSGGKDSQLMTIELRKVIPESQLVVIHSHLGRVEWEGVIDHITNTIGNLPLLITQSNTKDFISMVEARGMFPDKDRRQCTSDLKRGPIERDIRSHVKKTGNRIVVNCMGLRAAESTGRAKLKTIKRNKLQSVAGRDWYDWLPIHKVKTEDVIPAIIAAGQKPHWAYSKGMSRLSCCFCIMANQSDLKIAAELNPTLYKIYVQLEKKIGHTLQMSGKTLPEITGINIEETLFDHI